MTTRISLIRDCLTATGNNLYGSVDDDSREWTVAAAAFDAGAKWLNDEHDWNFGTEIAEKEAETSGGTAVAPSDPSYTYRFARPDDALHIIKVMSEGGTTLSDYRIVGNKIFAQEDTILVEYVIEPDPDDWPGLFDKAMRHAVMGGIYRGLNKDIKAAQAEEAFAERTIGKARPRSDLQEPGKARFVSTLASARSRRRG